MKNQWRFFNITKFFEKINVIFWRRDSDDFWKINEMFENNKNSQKKIENFENKLKSLKNELQVFLNKNKWQS